MARPAFLTKFLLAALACAATLTAADDAQAWGRKKKAEPVAAPAAAEPAKAPTKLFDLPHLQRQLDNGLNVIVVKSPFKGTVSVQIPVQTGSRNEVEAGKSGFAHFFEHMMFRGTPAFPPEQYGAIIQAAGADQNAYTDEDYTNYYVNFTTEDLDRILEVEADRFANLKYTEAQFRTEALAVKGEYLKNFSNPLSKGFERLQALAYKTHTYGHTGMGFFEDVEDMPNELEYSHEFFKRWYRPEYTSVIVVGDVELEPTFELVKKHFGGWQRGDYRVGIPAEPAQTAATYEHLKWDGPTLPWIVMGWKAPAFTTSAPDTAALMLGGEVWFGESSDLYQRLVVRERLVDQMAYVAPRNRDPGLFVVAVRLTDAKHAPAVTAAISDALVAARTKPLSAQVLADTKSRLKYGFAAGMNSATGIGAILAGFVHYERDIETLNRLYVTFDALTAAQVRDAANRVFVDAQRSVVSIGNDAALAGANDFRAQDVAAERAAATAAVATDDAPVTKAKPATTAAAATDAADAFTHKNYEQRATARSAEEMRFSIPLYEQRSDSPLVDINLMFKPGTVMDPPGKKGLAALTAAMLAEGGTIDESYEQLQRKLYPLSTALVAQVDKEMIKFTATVHRDNLDAFWKIASEQLTLPGFRVEDFQRLRQQQLNAVRVSLRGNNDEELGKEALYEEVYGAAHPYGTLNLGHAKDLESITLAEVREFWDKNFVRGRLTVAIAGGYPDSFRDTMLAPFARIAYVRPTAPKVPVVAPTGKRRAVIIEKESPAVAVSFGHPLSVRRGEPDWLALWLVRSWLGEHRNSSGRLYTAIREERGMNYGDYAYIEYFPNGMYLMQPEPNYARQHDLFQVWLRPLRDNNDAVFATRAAIHEIEQLVANGLTAKDFEAQRAFLRKFVLNLTATQAKQLGYHLDAQYYGTADFVDYVRDGLAALTLDEVNAAIRKHIDPKSLTFVFVAKDAKGLSQVLTSGKPTPVTYNSPKPDAIVAQDKVIAKLPLKLDAKSVRIVADETVFE